MLALVKVTCLDRLASQSYPRCGQQAAHPQARRPSLPCIASGSFLHQTRRCKGQLRCACHSLTQHDLPSEGPDISALDQTLQQQWNHSANKYLGNIVMKRFSHKKVWWKCGECPDGHPHNWLASVLDRSVGHGCPQCFGIKVCKHNSLATLAPRAASYWDSAKNQNSAEETVANSPALAHWACPECTYEWTARIQARARSNSGCPKCQSHSSRTKRPTFAASNHHLLEEWDHPRNALEGIFPNKITLGSKKQVHWVCNKCPAGEQHCWKAVASHRTRPNRPSGCPYCTGKAVCKCNSLQTLFPQIAAEWHPTKNAKTPCDYVRFSTSKAWWYNARRGSWEQSIDRRTSAAVVTAARRKHLQSQSAQQKAAAAAVVAAARAKRAASQSAQSKAAVK